MTLDFKLFSGLSSVLKVCCSPVLVCEDVVHEALFDICTCWQAADLVPPSWVGMSSVNLWLRDF